MLNATTNLAVILADLTAAARKRGISDSAWARAAGLRKESLSRLRRRKDCNWATLARLASAAGYQLGAKPLPLGSGLFSSDGNLPDALSREDEETLVRLALEVDPSASQWRARGPPFFMAGLAALLASVSGFDRRRLLALAESLHPGVSEPVVLQLWLDRSPLSPTRFLAQLDAAMSHARLT